MGCVFRLQNSPYFCVCKYARAVKQKVWNEAENRARDWGETVVFLSVFFFSLVRLARFARLRLLRHALSISLLILRKKPDCFAVYCVLSVSTQIVSCLLRNSQLG